MVPDQDVSAKLNTAMEFSPTVAKNGNPIKRPEESRMCASDRQDFAFDNAPEKKVMVACASNCQDSMLHMEETGGVHDCVMASGGNNEDVEVNIVEDVTPSEEWVVGRKLQDLTESSSSSSFGCTDSEAENDAVSSDLEIESQMGEDNASLMGFDGFSDLFRTRRKRLSTHWRKFIHPLMWRCKWVELHIRELCSQASRYERELAECNRRKQSELEKYATEDLGVKSAPFSCQNRAVKVMRRRRRKRVEETVDPTSYTSCHELFSYYAKRKCCAGFISVDDEDGHGCAVAGETALFDGDIFGAESGLPTLDSKHSDPLESILRKIEEAQSQVRQLRFQMDKVVTENAGKFTPNIISSNVDGESLGTVTQQTTGKKLFVFNNVTCNNGQGTPFPDVVQRTRHFGNCENMENEILTSDQTVNYELNNTEEVGVQRDPEPCSARQRKAENLQNANSPSKTMIPREKQSAKVRGVLKLTSPHNKRKRGRRKARLGRWNRRSFG